MHEVTLVLNPFGKTSKVCPMRNHQAFFNARREKIVSPHIIDTVKGSILTLSTRDSIPMGMAALILDRK